METDAYALFERTLRKRKNISYGRIASILQRIRNARYVAGVVEIAKKECKNPKSVKAFVKKVDDAAKATEPGPMVAVITSAARKLLGDAELPSIDAFDDFTERANRIDKKQRLARATLNLRLSEMAQELIPRVSPNYEWRRVARCDDSVFSSQPGKVRYVKSRMEIQRRLFEALGVPTEVREEQTSWDGFEASVWCRVKSDLDAEILQRRCWPLAEYVRLCWAMAANPRVNGMIGPFLDHGYEERAGISYQGRIVDSEKFEKAVAGAGPKPIGVDSGGRYPTLAEIRAVPAL